MNYHLLQDKAVDMQFRSIFVNDLHTLYRFSTKNVLLCGKPNMHAYLKPLTDSVNKLYKEGNYVVQGCAWTFSGREKPTCSGKWPYSYKYLCVSVTWLVIVLARNNSVHTRWWVSLSRDDTNLYTWPTCQGYCERIQWSLLLCNMFSGDNTIGESHMHRYWPFNPHCEIRAVADVQSAFVKASQTGEAVSVTSWVVCLVWCSVHFWSSNYSGTSKQINSAVLSLVQSPLFRGSQYIETM